MSVYMRAWCNQQVVALLDLICYVWRIPWQCKRTNNLLRWLTIRVEYARMSLIQLICWNFSRSGQNVSRSTERSVDLASLVCRAITKRSRRCRQPNVMRRKEISNLIFTNNISNPLNRWKISVTLLVNDINYYWRGQHGSIMLNIINICNSFGKWY